MIKVFLGGTCNQSTWRDSLIPNLNVDYFNPVVENWTPECQEEERMQREICDIVLYTITPKMTGVYSIAEVIDDSNKRPDKTVLCILKEDGKDKFTEFQLKSLNEVAKMVQRNGAVALTNLDDTAKVINSK